MASESDFDIDIDADDLIPGWIDRWMSVLEADSEEI